MSRSADTDKLFEALAKAQGQMDNAEKNSANPFYHSRYADLASVWDAIRKPLSDNGLCILQLASADGPVVTVTTVIGHSSGQEYTTALTLTAMRQTKGGDWETCSNPQAISSTITYAKRVSLQGVAGVAPDDDDGEGSEGRVITISEGQSKRIFVLMRDAGKKPAEVLAIIKKHGYSRTEDIAREKYEKICAEIMARDVEAK